MSFYQKKIFYATNVNKMLFMLGVTFAVLTFFVKAPIGYGAGTFSHWLCTRPIIQIWINRISGSVLIARGIRLAFERRI